MEYGTGSITPALQALAKQNEISPNPSFSKRDLIFTERG
jgi:hypothetical protein